MRMRILMLSIFLFSLNTCGMATTATPTTVSTQPETTLTTTTVTTTTTETTTTAPLPAPTEIELGDDWVLRWVGTSPDCTYIIEIDGEEIPVSTTSFDLYDYPDAVYAIRIKTVLGSSQSAYSELMEYTVRIHPDTPWNLRIEEGFLYWDEPVDAISYVVRINANQFDWEVNHLPLATLDINTFFEIAVAAVYPDAVTSSFSTPFYYHTCFTEVDALAYTFNHNAPADLAIDFSEAAYEVVVILAEDGQPLSRSLFFIEAKILHVSRDAFLTLPYGTHRFLVLTNTGYVVVDVEIVDDRQPYMISSNQITFTGSDIVLTFEVYDGSVVSLSGNDITEADYLIEGSTVTISAAYVLSKFADNPDRTVLILGYNVSANDYVSIGYVFIRLPA